MLEIELCLHGNKSEICGSDKISFIFLQNLPSSGKFLLLRLFNQIWETGTILIKWKNKRKLTKPKLFLGTTRLPIVEDLSILGFTFDQKLS